MQKGRFEDISFESIECYRETFKDLIWKENKKKTIAVVAVSLLFVCSFMLIPWGIMLSFFYFFYFLRKARTRFLKEFANKNNLEYKSSIPLSKVKGNLFKAGNTRSITHVITGSYNNQKARFFYYTYTIGTGKHSTRYNFTVFEVFFKEIHFPHMLLQSRRMPRFGKRGKKEIKVNLEEEFKKDYRLFVRDGYGIESMQIFNEEFLRLLQKENSEFSIELKKDRMYIYDNTFVAKKEQLKELYEVTEQITLNLSPLRKRMKNDFEALRPYFN